MNEKNIHVQFNTRVFQSFWDHSMIKTTIYKAWGRLKSLRFTQWNHPKERASKTNVWCFRHCVYLQSNACVCLQKYMQYVCIYLYTYPGGTYNIYNRYGCIIAWISHMFWETGHQFPKQNWNPGLDMWVKIRFSKPWFAFPTWKRWIENRQRKT